MSATKEELIQKILELNNGDNPFKIIPMDENLKAMWNIVDAKWIEFFGKAGLKEYYEIHFFFDENKKEVSYNEKQGSVSWKAGVPEIAFEKSSFSGKTVQMKKSVAFGVKEDLTVGEIYNFDFNTKKIKDPIFSIIEDSGWIIKRSFLEKILGM